MDLNNIVTAIETSVELNLNERKANNFVNELVGNFGFNEAIDILNNRLTKSIEDENYILCEVLKRCINIYNELYKEQK